MNAFPKVIASLVVAPLLLAEPTAAQGLEQRVKRLEELVAKIPTGKPQLDCFTMVKTLPASNNHQFSLPKRAGYQLVGGSCAFANWESSDDLVMIQVGPNPAKDGEQQLEAWGCYAKSRRNIPFKLTATYCRVVVK